MTTPDKSRIEYARGPIRGSDEGWADSVPRGLGYDPEEESLLDSQVLKVRRVTAKSAAEHFGCDSEEFRKRKESLIRVDYETWTASKAFDAELPEQVTYRREHVFVLHSDLLAGEDFCNHGMGRNFEVYDYETDEVKKGSPEKVHLYSGARAYLQSSIESEHREAIAEWLDGDMNRIPAGLGEVMQALYEEIAQEARQVQVAEEE